MHKWRLGLLMVLALTFTQQALANITHVSINQRLFDVGKLPLLKMNIVSNIKDSKRFQFLLQQQSGSERLMVNRINDYMLLVQGVEEVTDADALLLVQEYRDNYWYDVARLPLFAADVPAGKPPQGIKLSLYKQRQADTQAPAPQSQAVVTDATSAKAAQAVAVNTLLAPALPVEQLTAQSANPDAAQTDSQNAPRQASANPNNTQASAVAVELATDDGNGQCLLDYHGKQTLWRLANRYANAWQTNVYAAALGILDANPKAFYHGNPSALRADAQLRCPTRDVLAQYADKAAAEKKFDSLL